MFQTSSFVNIRYFIILWKTWAGRWNGARCPELVAGSGKHVVVVVMSTDVHGNLPTMGHVTRRAAHPITCTPLHLAVSSSPRKSERKKKDKQKSKKAKELKKNVEYGAQQREKIKEKGKSRSRAYNLIYPSPSHIKTMFSSSWKSPT